MNRKVFVLLSFLVLFDVVHGSWLSSFKKKAKGLVRGIKEDIGEIVDDVKDSTKMWWDSMRDDIKERAVWFRNIQSLSSSRSQRLLDDILSSPEESWHAWLVSSGAVEELHETEELSPEETFGEDEYGAGLADLLDKHSKYGEDWGVDSPYVSPMREGCSVKLFQDAAVFPDYPASVVNEEGEEVGYVPGECFESIYNAINEAKHFIYITGWSVDVSKKLTRSARNIRASEEAKEKRRQSYGYPEGDFEFVDSILGEHEGDGDDETIGELLKRKAEEGCVVLLHLWNEATSRPYLDDDDIREMDQDYEDGVEDEEDEDEDDEDGIFADLQKSLGTGMMGTHDEDVKLYFAGTGVKVVLSFRFGASFDHRFTFTHHQKSVIVDAPLPEDAEASRIAGARRALKAHEHHVEHKNHIKELKDEYLSNGGHLDGDLFDDEDMVQFEIMMKQKDQKRTKRKRKHQEVEEDDGDLDRDLLSKFIDNFRSDDDDDDSGDRRVIAFVGGLDLTNGRWDTPRHSLFRSLRDEHKHDFHNPWPITNKYGPREPWHDIHSEVEGPVARDVLNNFIERWKKQAPEYLRGEVDGTFEGGNFIDAESEKGSAPEGEEWNVQFLRTIDSKSALFEEEPVERVETSIHDAYINAIRKAEESIYVENQYFMGTSQEWVANKNTRCLNLIPWEIAAKIVSKIEENVQFNAYIVIPMYPEGLPADGAIQEILRWQHRTQEMMYKMVHAAIIEKYGDPSSCDLGEFGLEKYPEVSDYLNFYCLGKREGTEGSQADELQEMEFSDDDELLIGTADERRLKLMRRFSIYVHSKLMIVDDVYIIVGSANVNDRSMSGTRDTEMAIGAFQPGYAVPGGRDREVAKKKSSFFGIFDDDDDDDEKANRGEVHKFRMSLLAEHTGVSEPAFVNGGTLECVHRVNEIAKRNWDEFVADEQQDISSHLMLYPITIDVEGTLLNVHHMIPDSEGKFEGEKSFALFDKLTT